MVTSQVQRSPTFIPEQALKLSAGWLRLSCEMTVFVVYFIVQVSSLDHCGAAQEKA